MIRRRVATLFLLVCVVSSAHAAEIAIELTTPVNGGRVAWRACVAGTTSDATKPVVLVVHPMASGGDFYVQAPPSLRASGSGGARFKLMAYFAENSPFYEGARFEIRAFVDPLVPINEGDVLRSWPPAAAASPVVEVVRRSGTPDGCDEPSSASAAPAPVIGAPVSVASEPPRVDPEPVIALAKSTLPTPATSPLPVLAASVPPAPPSVSATRFRPPEVLAALIVLALIVRPQWGRDANAYLNEWITTGLDWLTMLVSWAGERAQKLFGRVWRWNADRARHIWGAKGSAPNLKDCALHVVRVAILLPLFWFALLADVRAIQLALELVFETDPTQQTHVVDDLLALGEGGSNGQSAAVASTSLVDMALEPLTSIWHQPLGVMAIGIGAIQAAFGIMLLWGYGSDRAVRLAFRPLFAERPLATMLFLVLVSAITALAAIRGYELSPLEVPGIVPATIAALIAFSMPWIMAYALHTLGESATDFMGPFSAAVAMVGLVLACTAIVALWTLLVYGLVSTAAAAFLVALVMRIAIGVFLWLTGLFADVLSWTADGIQRAIVAWRARRDSRRSVAATPLPAGLVPLSARAGVLGIGALFLLLLLGFSVISCGAQTIDSRAGSVTQHDPALPHDAFVVVIDTSGSILPDQFQKMKRAIRQTVARAVSDNDLVWLVRIGDDSRTATLFPMPSGRRRRSARQQAETSPMESMQSLDAAIAALEQRAVTTDLRVPLELAFELLAGQPRASIKTVIVGSDYVQDTGQSGISVRPIVFTKESLPQGMRVLLLFAQPTSKYLQTLRLSPTELFAVVRRDWVESLSSVGATATARLVDGVVQ